MVATLPPRTTGPPQPGEVPVCLTHPDRTSVWTSPTGYNFCADCRQSWDNLGFGELYPAYNDSPYSPVDLDALMTGERPEADWAIEPLLPAGKLCGIVSKRGDGKSILLLDIVAAMAAGLPILHQPAADPVHVIYIDMEMGPDDLYERLESLNYTPNHPQFRTLVNHLHYYQLISLPPLNTEEGGAALEDLVDRHQATIVVIDTVSRVVTGDENAAEPYRDLFRHTETMLKRRRITLARLDHLGKDKERGSRGSSAKEDPLDVVWLLAETAIENTLSLTLTKGRQPWIPRLVTIHREDHAGITTHVIHDEPAPQWLLDLVERIDRLELPPDTSVNKTFAALREAGAGGNRSKVSQAVRFRKGRPQSGTKKVGTTQNTEKGTSPGTGRYHQSETLTNIDLPTGTTPGTSQVPVVPVDPPSIGGYHPVLDALEDDFQPDPDDLPDPYEED